MKTAKEVIGFILIVGFIIFLIWAVFAPLPTYIGTYCSPQNECRYEKFNHECPDTDDENIVIGNIFKLKPNTCKEVNE